MIPFEDASRAAFGRTSLSGDNLHSLYQACQMVAALPGSVAEVGVYKGGSAKMMMKCLPDKTFWLFDTFTGNPVQDEGGHAAGDFAASHDEVIKYLAADGFNNHIIVPGVFPESADDYLGGDYLLNTEEFCLVHLDADTYEATKAGLEFFWPLLVQGGKFYIHDYDWHACPGVKPAVEEFLASIPEGAVATTEIAVPGAVKYLCIVKLVTTINDFDMDEEDEEIDDDLELEDAQRVVEVSRGAADGGEEVWEQVDSLLDVKEGNRFRMIEPDGTPVPGIWVATSDGYTDDEGKLAIDSEEETEAKTDGCVTAPEQTCSGCGDCDDKPEQIICPDCGHVNEADATICSECLEPIAKLEPRAEGDTTPLEEGPTPEGMTAEPVAVEDLKPTETEKPVSVSEIVANTEEAIAGKSPLDQIASGEAKVGRKLKDKTLKKKDE